MANSGGKNEGLDAHKQRAEDGKKIRAEVKKEAKRTGKSELDVAIERLGQQSADEKTYKGQDRDSYGRNNP